MTMKHQDSRTWVEDGEKYALLGLSIKWDDSGEASGSLMPRLTMLTSATFRMPAHWREWLGSIRAEEVEDCDVFFLSRLPSRQPEVLDGENQILQQKVWRFFVGLLLS